MEEERNAQHAQLQEQLRTAEETIVLLNVRTQRLEGKSPPTHFCDRVHLLPLPYLHVVLRSSGHVRRPRLRSRAAGDSSAFVTNAFSHSNALSAAERAERAALDCRQPDAAAAAGAQLAYLLVVIR